MRTPLLWRKSYRLSLAATPFLIIGISTFTLCPVAQASEITVKVSGSGGATPTITVITGGIAPNGIPNSFTDSNGTVTTLPYIAGANPSWTLPANTKLVGGTFKIGPKVPGAGTITTPPLKNGQNTYTSTEEAQKKKADAGTGNFQGSLASNTLPTLPSVIPFTPTGFSQSIIQPISGTITPTLTGITSQIGLTPTSDPDVYNTNFTSLTATYQSFDDPDLGLTGIVRESLDPSETGNGELDVNTSTGTGTLLVPLTADWYNSSNQLLTTSYEMLDLSLSDDPNISNQIDYSITAIPGADGLSGTFGPISIATPSGPNDAQLVPVPEPATLAVVGGAMILLATVQRRRSAARRTRH